MGFFAASASALESVASADAASYLVNKDVGAERWAIAQNHDDGTVTGNVFAGAESEPSFVWCEDVTTDGEGPGEKIFSCWGADLCAQAPCSVEDWTFLTRVPLSEAFFAPDGDVTWVSLGAPVTLPRSFFEAPEAGSSGDRSSGLQITRDGARVLISKDLAGERWAITRDVTSGTVTGNVFYPDGREPAFVFCDETESTETDVTLDCSFAEEAPALGPIEDGDGNYFVNQLTGDDDNDGTQALPFQTIEGAIAAVPQSGGRIYVAGGIFTPVNPDPDEQPDQLRIYGKSRVELYGSFNPSTWIRDRDLFPTRIDGGPVAVSIRESAGITIDGFTIEAGDAESSDGHASVGILIHESRLLTVRRNTVITGNGLDGANGSTGERGAPGQDGGDGADGRTCIDPRSRNGGAGGAAGDLSSAGAKAGKGGDGGKGRRADGDDGRNGGGSSGNAGRGGWESGRSGVGGDPGRPGTDGYGAASLGLDVSSYGVYLNGGGYGGWGRVGGGGGGGAGGEGFALICGGGGGGGGGGGQGGAPGTVAASGGSSIGIVVGYDSDAEILENVIVTGDGGTGGIGGSGGGGGPGGIGGSGGDEAVGTDGGGNGGRGGIGGRGGFAGNGAGGSSIGVLLADDPESTFAVVENNVFDLGTPGLGGRAEQRPELTFGEDGQALEYVDLGEEAEDEPIPF